MFFNLMAIALVVIVIFSCRRDNSVNFEGGTVSDANFMACSVTEFSPPPPPSELTSLEQKSTEQVDVTDKKIIKDGTLSINVETIDDSKKKLNTMVKKFNGYVSNETFSDENGNSEYSIKIRVPSANFDSLLSAIESGNKNIVSKNISVRDVTEDYIDLETRLKDKKNYLQKYNDLLTRAKSVKDILAIEENTRVIEEEIESTEGKLRYLSDQITLSTLDVTLFIKNEYLEKPLFKENFFKRLGQSLSSGFIGIVEFIIYFFRIWPVWIITILTFMIIRRIIKKRRNKK